MKLNTIKEETDLLGTLPSFTSIRLSDFKDVKLIYSYFCYKSIRFIFLTNTYLHRRYEYTILMIAQCNSKQCFSNEITR